MPIDRGRPVAHSDFPCMFGQAPVSCFIGVMHDVIVEKFMSENGTTLTSRSIAPANFQAHLHDRQTRQARAASCTLANPCKPIGGDRRVATPLVHSMCT